VNSEWFATPDLVAEFVTNLVIVCQVRLRQVSALASLASVMCASARGPVFRDLLRKRLLSLLDREFALPFLVALNELIRVQCGGFWLMPVGMSCVTIGMK
jgi:hypothetical protein